MIIAAKNDFAAICKNAINPIGTDRLLNGHFYLFYFFSIVISLDFYFETENVVTGCPHPHLNIWANVSRRR